MDKRFDHVEGEMKAANAQLRAEIADAARDLRGEIKAGNDGFQAFQRTLIQIGGGLLATMLGLLATFIGLLIAST